MQLFKRVFLGLFILLQVFLSLACQQAGVIEESRSLPQSPAQQQQWLASNLERVMRKQEFKASNGLIMPYRIFVPESYHEAKSLPLLVFLHGRGERGTDNTAKMYNSIGLFTGENSIISPNGQARFPAIVIVPQCSDKSPDQEWARWVGNSPEQPFKGLGKDGSYVQHSQPSESGAAVIELIEKTASEYRVDRQRLYLTGISMGGFGVWELTTRYPELFAAAVPMAGYSDPSKASLITHIPYWVFHGDEDEPNPVQGSRIMTQRLTELGAEVKYTEYEGVGHGETFEKAWQNEDILPWLFSKRQKEKISVAQP